MLFTVRKNLRNIVIIRQTSKRSIQKLLHSLTPRHTLARMRMCEIVSRSRHLSTLLLAHAEDIIHWYGRRWTPHTGLRSGSAAHRVGRGRRRSSWARILGRAASPSALPRRRRRWSSRDGSFLSSCAIGECLNMRHHIVFVQCRCRSQARIRRQQNRHDERCRW